MTGNLSGLQNPAYRFPFLPVLFLNKTIPDYFFTKVILWGFLKGKSYFYYFIFNTFLMDYIWLILSLICIITGVLGSLLPVLPGLPISWVGLVLLMLTKPIETDVMLLSVTGVIAIGVGILDYWIPAKGTKAFGGSKYGVWGTNIGLVVGLIVPLPLGFIWGPFLGAFIGEWWFASRKGNEAMWAATGSFVGFLTSTFLKLVVSIVFLGIFITLVWNHFSLFF
jgi:hypothetical protein